MGEKIRLCCHLCNKRVESSPGEPPCEVLKGWFTVSQWKGSGEVCRLNFCSHQCLKDWVEAQLPGVPPAFLKSFGEDEERPPEMTTLVLGIGNPILTDDGVGIKIARQFQDNPAVDVMETSEAGLALLDLVNGYDRLIIIDSIKTSHAKPGELRRFDLSDFKVATELTSFHGIDIATAFDLGRQAGYQMPAKVSIYAVAVKENCIFGENCTEEIAPKIPSIALQISKEEKL